MSILFLKKVLKTFFRNLWRRSWMPPLVIRKTRKGKCHTPWSLNSFHWSFLSPPFRRVLHAKKRHRSTFCMGCLSDMQQNSRCYLVFLNVYQTETNVPPAEMWCPGLRNPPCPALLAFRPEQKSVCGL